MSAANGLTPFDLDAATALALPRASSCPFDPNAALGQEGSRLQRAAFGDLAAQREVRNQCSAAAFDVGANHPLSLILAAEALMPARLCAAHRHPEDARVLAGALCFVSDAMRNAGASDAADLMTGEAVAIMEGLAAAGDEYCAIASQQLVGLHPAAARIAAGFPKGGE